MLAQYQLPENCHYKDEGYLFMGSVLAKKVLAELQSDVQKIGSVK
jgi:hypothetical protein